MRSLIAYFALTLALLLSAAPAETSCAIGTDQSVTTVSVSEASLAVASVVAGDVEKHCHHVPCTDSGHNHTSCGGHSIAALYGFTPLPRTAVNDRVAIGRDMIRGLTLLPPVPPPLS